MYVLVFINRRMIINTVNVAYCAVYTDVATKQSDDLENSGMVCIDLGRTFLQLWAFITVGRSLGGRLNQELPLPNYASVSLLHGD